MNTRHKWADVAIAFAEGKTIQLKDYETQEWRDWPHDHFPRFDEAVTHWRIKPSEPVVRWLWVYKPLECDEWHLTQVFLAEVEAKEFFRKETQRKKLEYTRTEFPAEEV